MRQFFKFFTASCLGTLVALALIVGILVLIGSRLASSLDRTVYIAPNSVLELHLDGQIPEKTNNLANVPLELADKKHIGLYDYQQMILHAAQDDNIKGILLRTELSELTMPEAAVLRRALATFRESGKFVYAYGRMMTQNGYYLNSVADSVYMSPMGIMEFRGMAADVMYFKKLMDKLDLEVDVFYAGQFKSATEPFRSTSMSDANRLQLRAYIEDLFQQMLDDIGRSRGIATDSLRYLADRWTSFSPDSARQTGLIDGLIYEDQLEDRLRQRVGLETGEEVPVVKAQDYFKTAMSKLDFSGKDKVALVFMEGEINVGKEEGGIIHDEPYLKILEKIADDDRIKSVVLRVNSPGGSVLASDNILKSIRNIQEKGKPVVVSMGRYAASGGYYISCYADSIFAQPSTLTGSIGVFSLIPNFGKFLDQKLGLTFDTVRTTRASTYLTGVYGLGPEERHLMQKLTDDIYRDFLHKVSEGRGMTVAQVDSIAQGRIWTGQRALEIGLVDALGYTDDALACAARMASLESYRVDEYPKVKDPLMRLLEKITGSEETTARAVLQNELGSWYAPVQHLMDLRKMEGVQARLPFQLSEQ